MRTTHERLPSAKGVSSAYTYMAFGARLLTCALLLAGCKGADHTAGGGDDRTPTVDAGPPVVMDTSCSDEGAVKECGRVDHMDGNYVTCSMGHTTCTDGHWTPCVGDHYVERSQSTRRMDGTGAHTLAAAAGPVCVNICDPYCVTQHPDPGTVDAGGIQPASGGGVTLVPEGGTDGGTTDAGPGCSGLQCQIAHCMAGTSTTVSGVVYDPAGKNPLYNAYVYVPRNLTDVPPNFNAGASCDTCSGTGSFNALQVAQTDAAGQFTLNNVPSGSNIPIIVQMGKWRREIVLKTVTSCTNNTVVGNCTAPNPADCIFRLPKNQNDGYDPAAGTYTKASIPQIAIVSGAADPFDCLLLKAGIDPGEVGDNTSNKRVHYYESDRRPGNSLNAMYGSTVVGSTLWNNLNGAAPSMMSYDVILLPCEGGAIDKQTVGNTPYANLINYTNAGGRTFITHFGYVWLEYPAAKNYVPAPDNWGTVGVWTPTGVGMTSTVYTQDPLTGVVNTTFPKGGTFSQWLLNVGASTTAGQLTIHEGRQDLTTIGAGAQPWMSANDTKYPLFPNYKNLFTFNTPYGAAAANQCGRVVYSDFHVSANALVGGSSQCLTDADCGFTATCVGSSLGSIGQCSEPCRTAIDCPSATYTCAGAVKGSCQSTGCTKDKDCGGGRVCNNGVCSCSSNSDCGTGTCGGATCTPTACTSSGQCGAGTCGGGSCNTGIGCHTNANCGLGTCGGSSNDGTCAGGASCHKDSNCGPSGTCGSGANSTAGTCNTNGAACHKNADCDNNSCGNGTGSSKGTCAQGGGASCHKDADCDSSSCGSGTSSSKGTCAIGGGTACHKNGDCDSSSCGSGTGSNKGTCGIAGGTACHKDADCDSSSCGNGTGSSQGSCNTSGATCHKNTDCDSNSCGTGTGSTKGTCAKSGGVTCHQGSDCDSGTCGSGSNGSTKGSCNSSGKTCHKKADCDSNSCGTGAGSTGGVCGAGTCTKNQDCGTGGTCTAGICTAGSCKIDTDCGTALGLCVGATCSTKTCGADSTCGVSNLCVGATCTTANGCSVDSDCTASNSCTGATCSTKSCGNDTTCTVGHLCTGATCSNPTSCAGDSACPASGNCSGATCSNPSTCAGDSGCPASNSCTGAKCGSPGNCSLDTDCAKSQQCNGATCGKATCAGDAACTVSNLCNGAKCSKATCSNDGDCPLGTCSGAKCTPPASCGSNADCGASGGKCKNSVCSQNACTSNTDCGIGACNGSCSVNGCVTGADCLSGTCTNGACACNGTEQCATSQTCVGFVQGSCQKACTVDADCAPDTCHNGQCGGCRSSTDCHDNAFSSRCTGVSSGSYGTCSVVTPGEFPAACRQGNLTAQEKALEFMFFDLTACVSPDNAPPPTPPNSPPSYQPATFTEDFVASCPKATTPIWREFDWQAQIPNGASIVFAAQSGDTTSTMVPAVPLQVATATSSTNTGVMNQNYDAAFIDTGRNGTGAFNTASPAVVSRNVLRMTITLNPTSDDLSAPTLVQWKVQYDCVPDQ